VSANRGVALRGQARAVGEKLLRVIRKSKAVRATFWHKQTRMGAKSVVANHRGMCIDGPTVNGSPDKANGETKMQINFTNTFVVESRGKSVTITPSALSPEIIRQATLHGLKQKIADAAAGAAQVAYGNDDGWKNLTAAERREWIAANGPKVAETGEALMQKVADQLAAGDWGAERGNGGLGLSTVDKKVISIVRDQIKPHVEGYKDMSPSERDAAVWEIFGKQDDGWKASIVRKAETILEAEAKAAAELAAMAIDIKL